MTVFSKPGVIVIGGGAFARVVIETARAASYRVLGFIDPQPCKETQDRVKTDWLGDDEAVSKFPGARFVLGVGNIKIDPTRKSIVDRLPIDGRWVSLVHPSAHVSMTATIGQGAVVLPGAVICSGASIGAHSIVNIGAMIDHDVHVGSFVHIAPKACLGGGSSVGDHAYIGIGSVIRDHTDVEARTLVAMGAVVTKRHPVGSVLVGVPARSRVGPA